MLTAHCEVERYYAIMRRIGLNTEKKTNDDDVADHMTIPIDVTRRFVTHLEVYHKAVIVFYGGQ